LKALTIVLTLSALALASACSSSSKARKAETLPVQTSDDSSASADQRDGTAQTDQTDLAEEPAQDRTELESTVYFDFDSATLSDSARAKLSGNAEWLQQNPDKKLLIAGHTDEVGTNEYNIALGQQRAQATYDFLIRLGVDPDRLATMSYGEEQPADPGRDALNRRSEFEPRAEGN
jgi:peptidoglycan-associated lipoprotein